MTEKRFKMFQSELTGLWIIHDENKGCTFSGINDKWNCKRIVNVLNKQNEIIQKQNDQISTYCDDNERYSLGVDEPVKLKNPRFEPTGCDTEIKDTSNNHYYWLELSENVKAVIDLLNELDKENKELRDSITSWSKSYHRVYEEKRLLKAQLYCNSEDRVCNICKHQKLIKKDMGRYYIAKCEKGHEECSKESVRHCEDFKLKELQE